MRDKFEKLYKRIQKISRGLNSEQLRLSLEKNIMGLQRKSSVRRGRIGKKNSFDQQAIRIKFNNKETVIKYRKKPKLFR
jgi:hypothetical protein